MYKVRLFEYGKGTRYLQSFTKDGFEFDYDPDTAITYTNKSRVKAVVDTLRCSWSLGRRDSISIESPEPEPWHKTYIILLERFNDNRDSFANELYELDSPRHFIEWASEHHPKQAKRIVNWITRTL